MLPASTADLQKRQSDLLAPRLIELFGELVKSGNLELEAPYEGGGSYNRVVKLEIGGGSLELRLHRGMGEAYDPNSLCDGSFRTPTGTAYFYASQDSAKRLGQAVFGEVERRAQAARSELAELARSVRADPSLVSQTSWTRLDLEGTAAGDITLLSGKLDNIEVKFRRVSSAIELAGTETEIATHEMELISHNGPYTVSETFGADPENSVDPIKAAYLLATP